MAGQSDVLAHPNHMGGLTLAAGQALGLHAMRWTHCDRTVAMHGPKVPSADQGGEPVKAQRAIAGRQILAS